MIDVNCTYIETSEVTSDLLNSRKSELTIFQSNIRSIYINDCIDFDYEIQKNLSLNVKDCEDLWLKINSSSNSNRKPNSIVIGDIYLELKLNWMVCQKSSCSDNLKSDPTLISKLQ